MQPGGKIQFILEKPVIEGKFFNRFLATKYLEGIKREIPTDLDSIERNNLPQVLEAMLCD